MALPPRERETGVRRIDRTCRKRGTSGSASDNGTPVTVLPSIVSDTTCVSPFPCGSRAPFRRAVAGVVKDENPPGSRCELLQYFKTLSRQLRVLKGHGGGVSPGMGKASSQAVLHWIPRGNVHDGEISGELAGKLGHF